MCWMSAVVVLIIILFSYWIIKWVKGSAMLSLSSKTKYLVVTGCDRGFGHLFTKRMDRKGFHVFAGCLTEEGIKTVTEVCSTNVRPFLLDVTVDTSVEKALKFVTANLPANTGIWALVNNAGIIGQCGGTCWMNEEDYNIPLNVNFHGTRRMCDAFHELLKLNRGRIVNTSSTSGFLVHPFYAPYGVSKHAVEAYSDALRREMRFFGVSVHIIEPNFYNTGIVNPEVASQSVYNKWEGLPPGLKDAYGEEFCTAAATFLKDGIKVARTRLEDVVDAYEHACIAKYPKTRYLVSFEAKYIQHVLRMLPTVFADTFMYIFCVKPKQRLI